MSKPTYVYFNVRARGELPRLVAAYGGIDYEDKRVNLEDFTTLKDGELTSRVLFAWHNRHMY